MPSVTWFCRLERAVLGVIAEGSPEQKTRDMGGTGGTRDFTKAVCERIT